MKKKVISALLCAAMVATMLVGCGGSSNDSKSSGGDGKKLVYWAMWSKDEPQAKVIQDAIAKYTEDTGVEVDVQFKGRSGQREGLQPALDAKQNIDLFDEDVNRVNGSWGKYLLDLEDVAKDYESEHGNETLFKIARAAYEDGTLHSIPYQPSIFGFFYNKTLFDKAGIKEVPTTWDELTAACEAIKAYDDSIYPWGIDMTTDEGQAAFAYYTWNNGGGFVDDEGVLAAAQSFADFAKKGYFSKNIATNVYPAGQNQEFAPGDAAIVICGSWLPNEAKASVAEDLEWGYFNYPSVPNGKDDNTANNIANQVFAINKDSKMADEAFELITYITSGDYDKEMTTEALCIPTDKANSDAWPTELAEVKAGFDATTTYYDWAAGAESNNDLTGTLKTSALELAAGKLDAAGFISTMKKAAGK